MTASRKKKSIIRIVAAAAVAAVLFGAMFAARKMIAGSRSVPVISVMNIADTWIDTGSYGYGQISQGGTQQVWNDRSLLISAIYVSEGDHVSRGDALMQYDVTQARLQEDSCRIEYEMAQRDLGKARDRLAYIRTFRPNTRPEPLRMLYPETVDITRDEDGKLLIGDEGNTCSEKGDSITLTGIHEKVDLFVDKKFLTVLAIERYHNSMIFQDIF